MSYDGVEFVNEEFPKLKVGSKIKIGSNILKITAKLGRPQTRPL